MSEDDRFKKPDLSKNPRVDRELVERAGKISRSLEQLGVTQEGTGYGISPPLGGTGGTSPRSNPPHQRPLDHERRSYEREP